MRNYQPRQDAFVREKDDSKKTRRCDHPACEGEGLYRAPRAPDDLSSYYWFCLEHVQAYNRSWDFCKGMGIDAIENMVRADTTWHRPTWPLGRQEGCVIFDLGPQAVAKDPFSLFQQTKGRARANPPPKKPMGPEAKAMTLMGLEPGYTEFNLKRKYKQLARLHHPDANNGDKAAEERFKSVTEAYKILLDRLKAAR
ncbi:DnaJ-class molecular chaperone [Rhodospirillaceae bacterium LM-1]|nr:DnaJ-class molecular chaperone [Rhodospirillaceae bacterium LM-1]